MQKRTKHFALASHWFYDFPCAWTILSHSPLFTALLGAFWCFAALAIPQWTLRVEWAWEYGDEEEQRRLVQSLSLSLTMQGLQGQCRCGPGVTANHEAHFRALLAGLETAGNQVQPEHHQHHQLSLSPVAAVPCIQTQSRKAYSPQPSGTIASRCLNIWFRVLNASFKRSLTYPLFEATTAVLGK